jgi:hypothetical protein
MKIVLLTPNYFPEKGACAERVRYLAEFLYQQGHEVLVVTTLPNYPQGKIFETYKNRLYQTETINKIQVLRYWVYASHNKNLFHRLLTVISMAIMVLFSWLKLLKFRPQFVYVQSPPLFLALSGFILATFCQAKLWLNVSDLWSRVLVDLDILQSKRSIIYKLLHKIELFLYAKASFITGQSQEIINEILPHNTQTILCRTGVDCALFKPMFLPITEQKLKRQPIRLVYAGLLGLAQGVLAFCQELVLPPLVELHIYGEGAEKDEIALYLKQNPEKRIFLHPAILQNDLAMILPTYDIALILQCKTIFGTVPSKLYEAVACGLQVWYLGGGEGANLVQKYDVGQVFSSHQTCYHTIAQLNHSNFIERQTWQAHKEKYHQIALQHFDRQKILKTCYNFFSNRA